MYDLHVCVCVCVCVCIFQDLIVFPDDCEYKRVSQCTTGRVYVLIFKLSNRRLFFWMQVSEARLSYIMLG